MIQTIIGCRHGNIELGLILENWEELTIYISFLMKGHRYLWTKTLEALDKGWSREVGVYALSLMIYLHHAFLRVRALCWLAPLQCGKYQRQAGRFLICRDAEYCHLDQCILLVQESSDEE